MSIKKSNKDLQKLTSNKPRTQLTKIGAIFAVSFFFFFRKVIPNIAVEKQIDC